MKSGGAKKPQSFSQQRKKANVACKRLALLIL